MENKKKLIDKAIDLKGKKYVLVSDRVVYFNENYSNGSINIQLISEPQDEMVVMKATVVPDCNKPERVFTDYSQAKWGTGFVNKTSAMENASTSAVGRALAMMGIGVIDSIASVDEINKATNASIDSAKEVYVLNGIQYEHHIGVSKTGKNYDGWFPPKDSKAKIYWTQKEFSTAVEETGIEVDKELNF